MLKEPGVGLVSGFTPWQVVEWAGVVVQQVLPRHLNRGAIVAYTPRQ